MAIKEHPMQALAAYLPDNSFDEVVDYIHKYKVHLTVTKQRKTILGDYRHSFKNKNHRISINGNLNKYEFLITLLHELAHLLTFENYSNRVEPHGKEWKHIYSLLLKDFISKKNIFPEDVELALIKTIHNPAATANGEIELLKVLRKYNITKINTANTTVENLPVGSIFKTENGREFKKGILRRKRYECIEIVTGKLYSFSAIAEVSLVTNN